MAFGRAVSWLAGGERDMPGDWLRGEVMEWLNSRPRAEPNSLDAVERRRRAKRERVTTDVALSLLMTDGGCGGSM